MNKNYSFRRDKVHKIFKDAMREGLQLPECKRPEEQSKKDHPNYCPYHRVLGHTIEDCYVFKDWVERQYQEGKITLSKNVLSEQQAEHTRYVTTLNSEVSSQGEVTVVGNKVILPSIEDDKPSAVPEELWEVFISKGSMKMLKRLAELSGITWKCSQEPPKGPPKKQSKKKNKKKKRELSNRNKSIIEEYIETLDEYEQKEMVLITLKDYFPEEVKELLGELDKEIDEDDEDVQVETCRVISGGEYPLDNPEDGDNDNYDSFFEPEESYDHYGRPYVSKKQRKKIAFRERVKMPNAKLLEPYQQTKPKEPYYTPKTPKYKVLRKVMPAEDIPAFIQRVTEESTNRLL
ncbi:NAD(P)-binding domain-containing protein [Dioscorea alata]|uniref:NAD(P)-binding domain-containing protein n=1 Tax=Dioscorea alata TaxID=55571 RepID=A0ACB7WP20_DIOAL|nr:NAD(P)-binding domain-containing protein [Dioscorea alata]